MTTEPRDRIRNPSINFPRSSDEAAQAIIHKARQALFDSNPTGKGALNKTYTTDAGLGTSRQQRQADWLNQQQSIIRAYLEDALDRIDESAKEPIS